MAGKNRFGDESEREQASRERLLRGLFGEVDPRSDPDGFFSEAEWIDYDHAYRANIAKQNWSVFPRHWYMDADFRCRKCHRRFTWTAEQQKLWFEEYFRWVGVRPQLCRYCSAAEQHLLHLQREYDNTVGKARNHGTAEEKRRIVEIVGELLEAFGKLPDKMLETRDLFEQQLRKLADTER
jgi:hypothetical protein